MKLVYLAGPSSGESLKTGHLLDRECIIRMYYISKQYFNCINYSLQMVLHNNVAVYVHSTFICTMPTILICVLHILCTVNSYVMYAAS